MSENRKKEFFVLAKNMRYGLQKIYELASQLEIITEAENKEIRYTKAIRDNIEIMCRQIDEISDFYGRINGYDARENNINTVSFTMKETRALIADDDENNTDIISQILKQFNIEVDTAKNGEEAVELYKQKKYDVIFMDYLMPPGINGIEAVRQIRSMGKRGEKQLIIGLSAEIMEEFKKGLNQYNVEIILFKPVKHQQIAVILKNELPEKIVLEMSYGI